MTAEVGHRKIGREGQVFLEIQNDTVDDEPIYVAGVSGINEDIVILTSGSVKSVSWTSQAYHNYGAEGLILYWDILTQPSSGTVCMFLDYYNPASQDWTAAYQTAYFNATGTVNTLKKYIIYPGAVDDGSQFTAVCRIPIPLHWRIRILHSAPLNWDYAVGASYLGA